MLCVIFIVSIISFFYGYFFIKVDNLDSLKLLIVILCSIPFLSSFILLVYHPILDHFFKTSTTFPDNQDNILDLE